MRASAPAATPETETRHAARPLAGNAARHAPATRPATARSDGTGSARAETRGGRLRRIDGLLWRAPRTRPSYSDPLFERPDLIEDDYYRLRKQPRG